MTASSPPPEPQDDPRSRARADLIWYLRHADALARWPVLPEAWAQRLERRRLASADRDGPITPGPPTSVPAARSRPR